MKIGGGLTVGGFALAAVLMSGAVIAHPGHDETPSYAKSGPILSFYSTPNRNHIEIKADEVTTLAKVGIDVKAQSDVLIQYTAGLATVTADGCPCSARMSIKVDDHEPVVVKRVNLGTIVTKIGDKYQPDRQAADGSFALPLEPGKHEISLIVQRIEGSAPVLHAFYPNMQVLAYPNKK